MDRRFTNLFVGVTGPCHRRVLRRPSGGRRLLMTVLAAVQRVVAGAIIRA